MRLLNRTSATLLSTALLLLTLPAVSTAAPKGEPDPGGDAEYVIISATQPTDASALSAGSRAQAIGKDTLIVVANPDGSLPGGVSEADLHAIAQARLAGDVEALHSYGLSVAGVDVAGASSRSQSAQVVAAASGSEHSYACAPYPAGWISAQTGIGYIGLDSSVRVSYWFNVTEGTNQQAAGQGLGYWQGYNGSQLDTWPKWYGLGLATSGSPGGGSVPWGNIMATTSFKAKSTVVHAATGYWGP